MSSTASSANREVTHLIIGAGMAGLIAARTLQEAGRRVTVIDKGRGVGGRMATRRFEDGVFDHGAQFITVRDGAFADAMQGWLGEGVADVWYDALPTGDGESQREVHPRYRGHPGMTAIPKALAAGLDVRLSARAAAVGVADGRWQVRLDTGEALRGDVLVMTPPVPQSLQLLADGGVILPAELDAQLRSIDYHPCLAMMVLLDEPSKIPAPGAVRVESGAIRWIADNRQKGVSPLAEAVTIHASPEFSRRHWTTDRAVAANMLLAEAEPWIGSRVKGWQMHGWRYSQPVDPTPTPNPTWAGPPLLIFAGDAFGGGRVEGAALSGLAAARQALSAA